MFLCLTKEKQDSYSTRHSSINILSKLSLITLCTFGLMACGEENDDVGVAFGLTGNANNNDVTENRPPEKLSWQRGVFEGADMLKNKCAVVRTSLDIDGNSFPDEKGSIYEEQMWLRSWTNETYLWYSEVEDINPIDYASAQAYFDILVTNELTPSGDRKDNFHFFQPTDEYQSFSKTGIQAGYGIEWAFINPAPPRDIRVATVDTDSSASDKQVLRGYKLVRINQEDVENGNNVDFLNDAIFPSSDDVSYEFTFIDNEQNEIVVELEAGVYPKSLVNHVNIIDTDLAKVGYLKFDAFLAPAQDALVDAFNYFFTNGVNELVLDLRYNGGGLLAMSAQLGYMIAGPDQTDERIFELSKFNDKHPSIDPITGLPITPTPFYSNVIDWDIRMFTDETLPSLDLTRVFVLTTEDTCSASESLINGLRGIDVEVIQIGGQTCGKPYGFYPAENCGTTYFTIQFSGTNEKGFGDYASGFRPSMSPKAGHEVLGCVSEDDFDHALGGVREGMLSEALWFMESGTCLSSQSEKSLTYFSDKSINSEATKSLSLFDPRYRSILLENTVYQPLSF